MTDMIVSVCLKKTGESVMSKAERMTKSARARKKRKIVKEIKNKITKRYYAHMRHLRQKYNKIKARHHDE